MQACFRDVTSMLILKFERFHFATYKRVSKQLCELQSPAMSDLGLNCLLERVTAVQKLTSMQIFLCQIEK